MNKAAFFSLVDKCLSGECNEQEEKVIEEFCEGMQHKSQWTLGAQKEKRLRILSHIHSKLNGDDQVEKPILEEEKRAALFQYVAVLILFLALGVPVLYVTLQFVGVPQQSIITLAGERKTVTLPDGSVVQMNAESTLTFPEKFTGKSREVILSGESFFEIKKDSKRPFSIDTEQLRTTVLGTSFNIKANEGAAVEVTVATGRVQVATRDEKENGESETLIASPKQQIVWDGRSRKLFKKEVELESYLSWKEDVFFFENTPLQEVIRQLEKRYAVDLILIDDALLHCKITGKYKNEGLKNILEGLRFINGIEYHIETPKKITINGKPCQ